MKESLGKISSDIILQETWQSEDELRSNSFTPNNITFSNGVATYNGTTAYATSTRNLNGVYSVRFRLSTLSPSATQYLLDCRANGGTGYIRIDSTTVVSASSGTIYVDGILSSTISANSKEIVVSGISLVNTLMYIGRINSSSANFLNASLDLFQVWNRNLEPNEIRSLYDNSFAKNYKYVKSAIYSEKPNLYYGVSWDVTNSSPTLTRTGNLAWHKSLPIQSAMKGCILKDDITVNYYLNPNDWTKKAGGENSILDGTDGQVMVEVPVMYYKTFTSGNIREMRISPLPIMGYIKSPAHYIGAYEASLNRTNSKLSSVVNSSTTYRGGDNTNWDSLSKSLLGKPATSISRTNFRTYARNRGTGWNQQIYSAYLEMYWLFVIEYATFDSQKAVNLSLDVNGYKQGGLGNGVTTANSTEWSNFNGYNPFINCGASNSLASGTGEVSVNVPDFGGTGVTRTFTVNRYRGIELPFGHIWKWVDGVNIFNTGNLTQSLYIIDNPSNLVDATSSNARFAGLISNVDGYQKELLMGSYGDILPTSVGGSSSTYMCDYYYRNSTSNSWTALCVGGGAIYGVVAGLLCTLAYDSAAAADTLVGGRLYAR